MLQWRIILKGYDPDIEYIPGQKNIVGNALSQSQNKINQKTTNETVCTMETMSELYDTKEVPDSTFTISFNII